MAAKMGFSKKQIVLFAILGVAIVLVGLWTWNQVTPRPLGDRLEYLGKEDYGNVFGFDYFPASTYYYGTDMEREEIVRYFSQATYEPSHPGFIQFTTTEGQFILLYEKDSSFTTDKKFVISLSGSQYQRAKDSL